MSLGELALGWHQKRVKDRRYPPILDCMLYYSDSEEQLPTSYWSAEPSVCFLYLIPKEIKNYTVLKTLNKGCPSNDRVCMYCDDNKDNNNRTTKRGATLLRKLEGVNPADPWPSYVCMYVG